MNNSFMLGQEEMKVPFPRLFLNLFLYKYLIMLASSKVSPVWWMFLTVRGKSFLGLCVSSSHLWAAYTGREFIRGCWSSSRTDRWSGSPENQVWRLAGDVGAQTVSDAAGATEFSR